MVNQLWFFSVCMHLYVCVCSRCICVFGYTRIPVHVEIRGQHEVSPSNLLCLICLRQGLPITGLDRLAGHEGPMIFLSLPSHHACVFKWVVGIWIQVLSFCGRQLTSVAFYPAIGLWLLQMVLDINNAVIDLKFRIDFLELKKRKELCGVEHTWEPFIPLSVFLLFQKYSGCILWFFCFHLWEQ